MNRRALLAGAVAAPVIAATDALAAEPESGVMSFYVYPPTGYLAIDEPYFWWLEEEIERDGVGINVTAYQPLGMPETYIEGDIVELDDPVPMIEWVRQARFPRDGWGEPTFIRVQWQSAE